MIHFQNLLFMNILSGIGCKIKVFFKVSNITTFMQKQLVSLLYS